MEINEGILTNIRDQQLDEGEAFLLPLINQISDAEGCWVLVLDDYHLIQNQEIHKLFTYFLKGKSFCLL